MSYLLQVVWFAVRRALRAVLNLAAAHPRGYRTGLAVYSALNVCFYLMALVLGASFSRVAFGLFWNVALTGFWVWMRANVNGRSA